MISWLLAATRTRRRRAIRRHYSEHYFRTKAYIIIIRLACSIILCVPHGRPNDIAVFYSPSRHLQFAGFSIPATEPGVSGWGPSSHPLLDRKPSSNVTPGSIICLKVLSYSLYTGAWVRLSNARGENLFFEASSGKKIKNTQFLSVGNVITILHLIRGYFKF